MWTVGSCYREASPRPTRASAPTMPLCAPAERSAATTSCAMPPQPMRPIAVMDRSLAASHVLPFAEGNVAQRARREQLLELQPAVGQSVLVRILEQRLDRRPVRLDPVGEPIRPKNRAFLLEQRLQPCPR